MPVRIYALAKELNVDSKELVDLCAKAGVTGKGSALASLTDDEAEKVKAFILSGGQRPETKKSSAIKTDTSAPARRGSDLLSKRRGAPSSSAPAAKSPGPASTSSSSAPAKPSAPLAKSSPTLAAKKKASESAPLTRDTAYSGRTTTSKGIKVLNKSGSKDTDASDSQDKEKKRPAKEGTQVKLAPVPAASQPAPAAKKTEKKEDAQKPTIRLPKDAIKKAQQGSSGRLDQIREQAERKRQKEEDKKGKEGKGKRDGRKTEFVEGDDSQKRKGMPGMAGSRFQRENVRRKRVGRDDETTYHRPRRRSTRRSGPVVNTAAPRKDKVTIELPCSIRDFCAQASIPAAKILFKLMEMGERSTINDTISFEMAEHLSLEMDFENIELKEAASLEESLLQSIDEQQDPEELLEPRPPVITFLGHVDHGKTSLLDRVIGIDVVSGEAGGITQHIRAYAKKKDGKTISFVDTPGHEAFTEMRARGANVTDIAVLVVAADDGVMPQTEEAISHAKAAEVPIVVAMNKMDLPGANPDNVLQQLAQHELLPTEWGGDIEVIKTSAITGEGVDDLLETLLLTAEIHEYKANPDRDAVGVCLEAEQEPGRGVVAKLIVKNGTLKVGDIVVCGEAHGTVRAMYDTLKVKKKRKEAGPSIPVNVTGFDTAPAAGETFYVLQDISQAREIAARREAENRKMALGGIDITTSFERFQELLAAGALGGGDAPAELNLIIRADVRGSIEAIQKELSKLSHPEVKIKILQASVGGITVGDVTLAHASNAVIVGFNVIPDEAARSLADERGVQIRRYDVIYRVTSDIKDMLEGKLKPEEQVKELGRALVKQVFNISRLGSIAGCHVLDGAIERGCRIRVNRDGRGIGDYALASLRREKEDVKEVRKGYECGMNLEGFNDLKEGDILEAYNIQEVKRTLESAAAGAGE